MNNDTTRTIAVVALAALAIGTMLGNYWFTFGLWPRSWGSFLFFAATQLVLSGLMDIVRRERPD